ncbi:MAG TPA: CDP-archaeol synthase [Planctomycetota bacterium]|nr:CDP-archaeol synthase [Planctomycetota bacterium]
MLAKRFFAATLMISALTAALWLDVAYFHDSLMLHCVFFIGAYFSFREFWPLCRATGNQTFSNWGTISGCGLVAVHYFCMRWLTTPGTQESAVNAWNLMNGALAIGFLGTFLLAAHRGKLQPTLGGVAVTSLGLLYIFFLPSFVMKIRHLNDHGTLGGPVSGWNLFGHKMVVATIVLAKGCDVWAFLVGKLLGRHKAFPLISPGKTIEGLAAGLIGSVLTALLLHWDAIGVLSNFAAWKAALLGLLIGFSGIMGDLMESLLKRSAGAKDAGALVPGYGGVLDVLDSLMVAGPVAYYLIQAMI